MNNSIEFLDAFKHLEKICSEMYGQQHGVTLYIDEMARTLEMESRSIPGWENDLKRLKRLRYVRNTIVHDSGGYTEGFDSSDIEYLKEMYNRIMQQQDPLSLLRLQKTTRLYAPTKSMGNRPIENELLLHPNINSFPKSSQSVNRIPVNNDNVYGYNKKVIDDQVFKGIVQALIIVGVMAVVITSVALFISWKLGFL